MGKSSSGRPRNGSEVSSRSERRRTEDDPTNTSSSSSRRKSSRRDDDDNDNDNNNHDGDDRNPTSSSFSSSSRNPYTDVAGPSEVSSYATAYTNESNSASGPSDLTRNDRTADDSTKAERRGSRRESKSTSKNERSRGVGDSDEDSRNAGRRDSERTSRRKSSKSDRKQSARAYDDHNASLPQNQFPGQDPSQFTEPYRPPGLASEYYGDHGESVTNQPGVRPNAPSIIQSADQAHLMEASVQAHPPPEPSSLGQVGAAASFFTTGAGNGDGPTQSTPSKQSGRQSLQAGQRSKSGTSPRSSPGGQQGPPRPELMGSATIPIGVGAAAEYFSGHIPMSTANDAAGGGSAAPKYSNTTPALQTASPDSYNNSQRPQMPAGSASHNYGTAAAAGLAGAAAGAYFAGHGQSHSGGFQQSHHGPGPDPGFVVGQNQSAFPQMQHKHRTKRRGPLGKFVEWFKDPQAVAQYEQYSEAIGICKYCFDPNSSPADAPRRHHYHRRRTSSGGRHGSSARVDKSYRHSSSDDERRKRSSTATKVVAGGLAGYGAAKIGEALYKEKHGFDDTYSVKSGHPANRSRVSFKEDEEVYKIRKKSKYSSTEDVRLERRDSGRKSRRDSDKRSSGRRDSSSASSQHETSRGAALSVGAGAAGLALGAAVLDNRRRSRSRSRSPSRRKKYYSKRVSPRHSYVDLTTTDTGPTGFGAFFSSPSANEKRGKKSKGLFTFANASSSSSDADLAFGEGTVRRQNSKKGRSDDRKTRQNEGAGTTAAILGLAATGAALAAESDRRESKGKERRDTDRVSGVDSRRPASGPIGLHDHETTSDAENDQAWEDASDDDQSDGSVDTALAYGGRLSAMQSRESLPGQGTEKWDWRWNPGKDKNRKSSESRTAEKRFDPTAVGLVGAGLGVAASGLMSKDSTPMRSSGNLPPMQLVDPVATTDPMLYDVRRASILTGISPSSSVPPPQIIAIPGSIPLQQPQPIVPIASVPDAFGRFESTEGFRPTERYDDRDLGSSSRRRRDSSPAKLVSRESKNSVVFDLTAEQVEAEARVREKEERRRRRREEKDRRKSTDGSLVSGAVAAGDEKADAENSGNRRFSSADARAAKEAEIEARLEKLYEEQRKLDEEQRGKAEQRKRKVETAGVAAAAAAVGAGFAAAAISGRDDQGSDSEMTSKPRRKSSMKKSRDRDEEPESAQDRIARMAAQRVRSASPAHEDYSTFFVPAELAEHVKEHNEKAEHRDDDDTHVVEIIPGARSKKKSTFDPFNYRPFGLDPDDDPTAYPWPVPMLGLVEPTPPPSRAPSERGGSSPLVTATKDDLEDVVEVKPERKTSTGSKVTWGDHDTYVYEVQTPEYERSDYMPDSPEAKKPSDQESPPRSRLSQIYNPDDEEEAKVEESIPPVEEMSREQQEHIAMGKEFRDLPRTQGDSDRANVSKPRDPSPATQPTLEEVFGSTPIYQTPFAETVSDLGAIGESSHVQGPDVPKTGHGFVEDTEVPDTPKDESSTTLPTRDIGGLEHNESETLPGPRASKSERRRMERAPLSDEAVPTASDEKSMVSEVQPQDTAHRTPGGSSVFDYLVDEAGNSMPQSTVADGAPSTILTREQPSSPEEFAKPKRASTFGESKFETPRSKSRSDHNSDPEDWEKSSNSKKPKSSRKSSSKNDITGGAGGAKLAMAAVAAAAAAAAASKAAGGDDGVHGSDGSRRKKSQRDSVATNDDDDTKSVSNGKEEDKKSRRKSKRDSEVFDDDDTRSVTSSPADTRRKSKDKQSSGGLFSGLFSSSKSDVSTSSRKSSKSSKSEDGEKRKKKRSKDNDHDENASAVSDSTRKGRRDSAPLEQQRQESMDSVDLSVDDGFVSAEEAVDARPDRHSTDEPPFLAKRPEMPQPTVMNIPMDTDGVSGPTSGREPSEANLQVAAKDEDVQTARDMPLPPDSFEDNAAAPDLPTPASQRLSMIRTTDIPSSPAMTSSPTAVPIHFRRLPISPGNPRASLSSPGASPSSPLTTPRTRQSRPKSTEFRSGKEFRPLYLVETSNVAKATGAELDEDLPSLPSSRNTSAHPSIEDLRGEARAFENQDYFIPERINPETFRERGRRHSYSYWHDEPKRRLSPDYLDSRSATPVPSDVQKARDSSERKEKPKYEFHSPSELLEDPAAHAELAEELREPLGSPLPSVVSADHEHEYASARSGSQSPTADGEFQAQRRKSRSRSRSRSRGRRDTAVVAGLGLIGGTALGLAAADVLGETADSSSSSRQLAEHEDMYDGNVLPSAPTSLPVRGGDTVAMEPKRDKEPPTMEAKEDEEFPMEQVSRKKSKSDKKKKRKTLNLDVEPDIVEPETITAVEELPALSSTGKVDEFSTRGFGPSEPQTIAEPLISAREVETEPRDESAPGSSVPETPAEEVDEWSMPTKKSKKDKKKSKSRSDTSTPIPEPEIAVAPILPAQEEEEEWAPLSSNKSKKDKKKKDKRKDSLAPLDIEKAEAKNDSGDRAVSRDPDEPLTAVPTDISEVVAAAAPGVDVPRETTISDQVTPPVAEVQAEFPLRGPVDASQPEASTVASDENLSRNIPKTDPAVEPVEPYTEGITTSLSERASRTSFPWDEAQPSQLQADDEDPAMQGLQREISFVPTLDQINKQGNQLGAFEEAFERAVRARGLRGNTSREDAMAMFLSRRNNAPFMAKGGLTPIGEGSRNTTPDDTSPPVERDTAVLLVAEPRKAKKDKRKKVNRQGSKLRESSLSNDEGQTPAEERSFEFGKPSEPVDTVSMDKEQPSPNPFGNDFEVRQDEVVAQPVPTTTTHDRKILDVVAEPVTAPEEEFPSQERELQTQEPIDEFSWQPASKQDKKKKKKSQASIPVEESTPSIEVDQPSSRPVETAEEDADESWMAPSSKKSKKGKKDKKKQTFDFSEAIDPAAAVVAGGTAATVFLDNERELVDEPKEIRDSLDKDADATQPVSEAFKMISKEPQDETAESEAVNGQETVTEEWAVPGKKGKKGKKKSKSSAFRWDEPPASSEPDPDPEPLVEADQTGEPADEEPTPVSKKLSKKDKKKAKKGKSIDLADLVDDPKEQDGISQARDVIEGQDSELILPSAEELHEHPAHQKFLTAAHGHSSVYPGKPVEDLSKSVSPPKELPSLEELHNDPTHQDFLANAAQITSVFPSKSVETSAPVEPGTEALSSAKALHESPTHQDFLAQANDIATAFPPKSRDVPVSSGPVSAVIASAEDLHGAPAHQDFLKQANTTAVYFPSKPSEISLASEPLVSSLPSAAELHEAPVHQEFLTDAVDKAAIFPSKPTDTLRDSQTQARAEASIQEHHESRPHQDFLNNAHGIARVFPSKPLDDLSAPTPSQEILDQAATDRDLAPEDNDDVLFKPGKKSKKDKKKSKRSKSLADEESQSASPAPETNEADTAITSAIDREIDAGLEPTILRQEAGAITESEPLDRPTETSMKEATDEFAWQPTTKKSKKDKKKKKSLAWADEDVSTPTTQDSDLVESVEQQAGNLTEHQSRSVDRDVQQAQFAAEIVDEPFPASEVEKEEPVEDVRDLPGGHDLPEKTEEGEDYSWASAGKKKSKKDKKKRTSGFTLDEPSESATRAEPEVLPSEVLTEPTKPAAESEEWGFKTKKDKKEKKNALKSGLEEPPVSLEANITADASEFTSVESPAVIQPETEEWAFTTKKSKKDKKKRKSIPGAFDFDDEEGSGAASPIVVEPTGDSSREVQVESESKGTTDPSQISGKITERADDLPINQQSLSGIAVPGEKGASDEQEEWGFSSKENKKDKKKNRQSLAEELPESSSVLPAFATAAPPADGADVKGASSEPPKEKDESVADQEVSRDASTGEEAEQAVNRDDDPWGMSAKKSKKEKKKKRKSEIDDREAEGSSGLARSISRDPVADSSSQDTAAAMMAEALAQPVTPVPERNVAPAEEQANEHQPSSLAGSGAKIPDESAFATRQDQEQEPELPQSPEAEQLKDFSWAEPKKSKKEKKKKRQSTLEVVEMDTGASTPLATGDVTPALDPLQTKEEALAEAREKDGRTEPSGKKKSKEDKKKKSPAAWDDEAGLMDTTTVSGHVSVPGEFQDEEEPTREIVEPAHQHDRVLDEPYDAGNDNWTASKKKGKKGKKDKNISIFEDGAIAPALEPTAHSSKPTREVERSSVLEQEGNASIVDSDNGSDVSATTRERRKRRRSSPARTDEEPADLPRAGALTPPPDHDDIMDTALGVAAGLGFGESTRDLSPGARAIQSDSTTRDVPGWSFANLGPFSNVKQEANRDSGIQFADSPTLGAGGYPTIRDSGFIPSPEPRNSWDRQPAHTTDHVDTSLRPPRDKSPTSSTEDVSTPHHRTSTLHSQSGNVPHFEAPTTHSAGDTRDLIDTPIKRQISPVASTSKDRSSVLFNSSPAVPTPQHANVDVSHELQTPTELRRSPSIHGHHQSRGELRALNEGSQHGAPFDGMASDLIHRSAAVGVNREAFSPPARHGTDPSSSPPKSPLHTIPEHGQQQHRSSNEFGGVAALAGAGLGGAAAFSSLSRDDPASAGTKSLGRTKSRTSTSSSRNQRGSATSPYDPSNFASGSSTAPLDDKSTDQAATRDRDMSDVYDGYGAYPGSPMSPTRPPSVRKRQSMQQIKDLEARVDQLAGENRALAEAKIIAERHLEEFHLDQSRNEYAGDEALQTATAQLRERDEEILRLKQEVAALAATHETLKGEHEQRYSLMQDEHTQAQTQWQDSTRELDTLRAQHEELSSGMEDIVRHEIDTALAEKNAEIERLYRDLELAKEKIRELQSQILAHGGDDVIVGHDEDYFENACQQLCEKVRQWVLRYSKFSDTRVCRSTNEVRDEKVVDRFDNAVLDGSDVDAYLGDRIKRRDVFMSVVITMIWEHVFARYLFGMERSQRQKLKQLEKNLGEVGPARAVHQWRAMTLTLLAKREEFQTQRETDTEALVGEILRTLSKFLPPPQNLEQQIAESLRGVLQLAVDLSIEMRTQREEYIMLPPLQPEYDTNGDLARQVFFNASLMNERSGETNDNHELEANQAVVRMVLFPLVVMKADDGGNGDDKVVVCPAQVLVARPDKGKRVRSSGRVTSGGSVDSKSLRAASTHSLEMSGIDMTGNHGHGNGNMI